jgi:DNA-binding transcriptional LysR family regulator
MLKDFTKIETFLTVVNEKSFSKASAKLGISQPAVTQQIKFIEDYLDTQIVERKKNGIRLTKEGEMLFSIANKLERSIANAEKEMLKIINKKLTFVFGTSFTIGNYILPNCLNHIKEYIKNEVMVNVDTAENTIEQLLDKKIDLALVDRQVSKDGIIYREWLEDEMILFSNQPILKLNKKEDLMGYSWICREDNSHTKKLIREVFEEMGVDCKQFDVKSEVSGATMALNTVLKASKTDKPTVSIISKHVVADDVADGRIYEGRLKGFKIKRKLYIAYLKDRKHDAFIDNVVNYLMDFKM